MARLDILALLGGLVCSVVACSQNPSFQAQDRQVAFNSEAYSKLRPAKA
jgi:hypothetical protein